MSSNDQRANDALPPVIIEVDEQSQYRGANGRDDVDAELSQTLREMFVLARVEGRRGKDARPAMAPMRTMTTRNETGLGLLIPYNGAGVAQQVDDPRRTFTPRDGFAFVVPLRNNNSPKTVADPLDTVAAAGNHHGLATGTVPDVRDCEFRMLAPHEISRGWRLTRITRSLAASVNKFVRLATQLPGRLRATSCRQSSRPSATRSRDVTSCLHPPWRTRRAMARAHQLALDQDTRRTSHRRAVSVGGR